MSEIQNKMVELINQVSSDTRKYILNAKPKMISHVSLSDALLERTFNTAPEAESHIKREMIWTRSLRTKANGYFIDSYICRLYKCPASLYLIYYDTIDMVSMCRSSTSHIHELDDIRSNEPSNNTEMHKMNVSEQNIDKKIKFEIDDFATQNMIFDKKFPSLNTAFQYLQDAKTWSILPTTVVGNINATMNYYRCNLVSNMGASCPVEICLLSDEANTALLYRNTVRHNHESYNQIFESVSFIEVLDDDEDIDIPAFDTIEKWLSTIAQVPQGNSTVYCVDYVLDQDLKTLRFFLSTRQLLKSALDSRTIHVTSLETIHWNKFEVVLIGTTDMNHKFHHFGVAVCGSKTAADYEFIFSSIQKGITECYPDSIFTIKTLLSDFNPNIQNAFKFVYGYTAKTVTCSSSFSNSIYKLFINYFGSGGSAITEDIRQLMLLPSAEVFKIGVKLFMQKWEIHKIGQFKAQWLDENCNWYVGYSQFTPSKNIALESEYKDFRKTYLHNMPIDTLDLLMDKLFLAVKNWSNLYANGYKYATRPEVPDSILQGACRWLRQPKNIITCKTDSETLYYLSVNYRDKELFKAYQGREFSTLHYFFEIRAKYNTVRRNQENVLMCDCSVFFKYFVCQHLIGIAYLLNLYEIPLSLIPNPSIIPYHLKLD